MSSCVPSKVGSCSMGVSASVTAARFLLRFCLDMARACTTKLRQREPSVSRGFRGTLSLSSGAGACYQLESSARSEVSGSSNGYVHSNQYRYEQGRGSNRLVLSTYRGVLRTTPPRAKHTLYSGLCIHVHDFIAHGIEFSRLQGLGEEVCYVICRRDIGDNNLIHLD